MAASPRSFTLHLAHALYVTGSPLEGIVELDLRREEHVQEVHVELRGTARTDINQGDVWDSHNLCLVHGTISVWSRDGATSKLPSDTLRISFRFDIPDGLPPPCIYHGIGGLFSTIRYTVTAVAVRSGAFRSNRRISLPIAMVPRDPVGLEVRQALTAMTTSGIVPSWRTDRVQQQVRRGLWGTHATALVELHIPNLATYPLFTPIPFVIKIRTISVPITRAKAAAYPEDRPVFPQTPTSYEQLELKIRHLVTLKAKTINMKEYWERIKDTRPLDLYRGGAVNVSPRQWIPLSSQVSHQTTKDPSPDEKGSWIQEATFRSAFCLDCPPTFEIDLMKCGFTLIVNVPFPGLRNDLSLEMGLMNVSSGLKAPLFHDRVSDLQPAGTYLGLPARYWDLCE
ncbi:hypothetical protein C8Q77DRAFT_1154293 [Trametes polyzona]|nr:hypothetical protein C8Q77DRAFT_1154293 [Trametes polyzona]